MDFQAVRLSEDASTDDSSIRRNIQGTKRGRIYGLGPDIRVSHRIKASMGQSFESSFDLDLLGNLATMMSNLQKSVDNLTTAVDQLRGTIEGHSDAIENLRSQSQMRSTLLGTLTNWMNSTQ